MGQQSKADDLLAAIKSVEDEIDRALTEPKDVRNRVGVEQHGKLRKIKEEFDAIPDADPDKNRVNEAFTPVVKKLLHDIFEIEPGEGL